MVVNTTILRGDGPVRSDPVPGWVLVGAYTWIGLELVFQPHRFSRTPAYANLTELLAAQVWGGLYLAAAGLLVVYLLLVSNRGYAIFAHTFVITLTAAWMIAFVVRRLTDPATTAVNVVSWGVYLYLAVRSAKMIEVSALARERRDPT